MRLVITFYGSAENRKDRDIGEIPLKNGMLFTEIPNTYYIN